MKFALILAAFAVAVTLAFGAQDATLTPDAKGLAVVNVVLDRLRSNCVLSEDRQLLSRLAIVLSNNGESTATYRPGFDGGIWQVTEEMFTSTKACTNIYIQSACAAISSELNITWSSVQWSDLRKPLYSGLAAALYIKLNLLTNEMPSTIADQSILFNKLYGRPATDFSSVTSLTTSVFCQKLLDLVFILDASGSVSSGDFDLMKQFAADVADAMDINSGNVRVADITFSTSTAIEFDFDDLSNSVSIRNAILNAYKSNGGTATYSALDDARSLLSDVTRGARTAAKKVAILVTDGMSNSYSSTVFAAKLLRDVGVTIFTIGVGNYNMNELNHVASEPVCSHVLTLKKFDQIQSILTEIIKSSCEANVKVTPETPAQGSSKDPIEITYETPVPPEGKVVEARVNCGILHIYISTSDPRPGPAVYDELYTATPTSPAVIHSAVTAPEGTPVYMTVVGTNLPSSADGLTKCIDYNWTIGVVNDNRVKVVCIQNNAQRACTPDEVVNYGLCQAEDITTGLENPCTEENLKNGIVRFQYQYNPTKFLFCDGSGQYYVTSCPGGVNFNADTHACGYVSPGAPSTQENSNTLSNSTAQNPQTPVDVAPLPGGETNPCSLAVLSQNQYYFTFPPDAKKYIQCDEWGNAWVKPCAYKTKWSQKDYTCVHEVDVLAATHAPAVPSFSGVTCTAQDTFLADPCDYRAFYQCVIGTPVRQSCASGLEWDQVSFACNWPDAIQHDPKPAYC